MSFYGFTKIITVTMMSFSRRSGMSYAAYKSIMNIYLLSLQFVDAPKFVSVDDAICRSACKCKV